MSPTAPHATPRIGFPPLRIATTVIEILRPLATANGPAVGYIDGVFFGVELPRISIHDVEALEIYRGASEVPAQYGGANAMCGVILIWTRTGAGA